MMKRQRYRQEFLHVPLEQRESDAHHRRREIRNRYVYGRGGLPQPKKPVTAGDHERMERAVAKRQLRALKRNRDQARVEMGMDLAKFEIEGRALENSRTLSQLIDYLLTISPGDYD